MAALVRDPALLQSSVYRLACQTLQGCTRQTALERQDLSCKYLAHRELESVITITNIMTVIVVVVVVDVVVIIITITIIDMPSFTT